jgi:hypothetical protein
MNSSYSLMSQSLYSEVHQSDEGGFGVMVILTIVLTSRIKEGFGREEFVYCSSAGTKLTFALLV